MNTSKAKKIYNEAKSSRLHAEEILKCLEGTRELLEESMKEIDERIIEVINQRRDFESIEEKSLKHILPQPWHG
tara:strand:+ start:1889 stop:2110 length:222 start_codon:yes stop_codon:yes gene_type:complete